MGFSELFQDIFSSVSAYGHLLRPMLRQGDLRNIEIYLTDLDHASAKATDMKLAFSDIARAPHEFTNAARSLTLLLEHGVKPEAAFSEWEKQSGRDALEQSVWNVSASGDAQDIPARAIVLAEYLRYRLGRDQEIYQMPLHKAFADAGDLEKIHATIRLQHALVEYVATAGPHLPLNRGAALLHELRNMAEAGLWSLPLKPL